MILKMAFRNIFRHKTRTILTLITMSVAIFLAIVGEGLNIGMERQMVDLSIKTDVSKNKIYQRGFYEEIEENEVELLDYEIENIEKVEKILKDGIYSKRILFDGNITNGKDDLKVKILGVNPKLENKVFNRKNDMVNGEFLKENNENEIVIGYELAKLMNLKIGEIITLMGRTKDGTLNADDIKLSGIIRTGNPLLDNKLVFIKMDFAKEFIGVKKANDIAVLSDLTEIQKRNLEKLNVEIINWKRELKDILTMIRIRGKAFNVISFTILIMAGVGIANTMLMIMLERKKEIGIMLANGMSQSKILRLFLLEGIIVGVIGSGIGWIFGVFVVNYYQRKGIPLPEMTDFGMNFPFTEKIYAFLDIKRTIIFFTLGVIIAILATIYPAYKASKLNPVEIIRK